MESSLCPCLSNKDYQVCCSPLHQGIEHALTAEQLMRSRYAAFVKGNIDYLIATLHPTKHKTNDRAQLQQTIEATKWLGLKILKHKQDLDQAEVEFVAFYEDNPIGQLHECSRFVRENGQWFYVDGQFLPALKLGRNEPCFCGSAKKLKHCHGK